MNPETNQAEEVSPASYPVTTREQGPRTSRNSNSTVLPADTPYLPLRGVSNTGTTRGSERLCFICLDGSSSEPSNHLLACCTRCFAAAHSHCWSSWRMSQANHARRLRISGTQINVDPFICSICKSGSARISGERVSRRWLEAFAFFGSLSNRTARLTTGLFSALSGSRNEQSVPSDTFQSTEEDSEGDFLDFLEDADAERWVLLTGGVRRFIGINVFLATSVVISLLIMVQFFGFETSLCFILTLISAVTFFVSIGAYFFVRYERHMNVRRIEGS
jgi:hypothetical protein